jgi:hypothetical protein
MVPDSWFIGRIVKLTRFESLTAELIGGLALHRRAGGSI